MGPEIARAEGLEPERIVRLEDDAVVVLDQRLLPDEEIDLRCSSAAEVAEAIRSMAIRGAPAIGVAAAYGYALAATRGEDLDAAHEVLASARPTAVNLRWALEEMRADPTPERARAIHELEVARCRRMAAHAAGLVVAGSRVLTHCNTGGLATGGYGTAFGAIRAAWERGLVEHVWVGETRPRLQGARLTAWELEMLGIPFAVIADGAAASLMAVGEVECVVTGADRIAVNGDTANKIGTYGLAVAARHHGIPFYVVAPTSTIDPAAASGTDIPIEERDPAEVSTRFAARNPAFDVTPAKLIAAIVTEDGVHRSPYAVSLPAHVPGARPRRSRAFTPESASHFLGTPRKQPGGSRWPARSASDGGARMKALVLAAGYATRLYPLTVDRPKALLEVGGKPMLDRVLERLQAMGVDETIVVTNAKFTPHFEEWARGKADVVVVNDGTTSNDDRLGAIGDIGFVLEELELDDDLVVVAGDNLFSEDISGFAAYGREVDAPVLAVHDVGDLASMREYNQVEVDPEGKVTFMEEKPDHPRTTLAGVALYYYPRRVLPLIRQYLAEGNNPDQPGRLPEWLYPRTDLYIWRLPGEWYDIGSAETLQEADRIFSQSRND